MNDPHVLDLTRDVYDGQLAAATQMDQLLGMANPNGPSNFRQHLPVFERRLPTRMVNVHRRFITERLEQLEAPWVEIEQNGASTAQQRLDGQTARTTITSFRNSINTYVRFNADDYINRPVT
jgi:hypothetical protein